MIKQLRLMVVLLILAMLVACGQQGGSSSSGSSSSTSSSDSDSDTTVVDVETDIEDGTDSTATIDALGVTVEDAGDLVGSATNPWYYTKNSGVSDDGFVIGQTNAGSIVRAGFVMDSSDGSITSLGIHTNGPYSDYYNLQVSSTPDDDFIYSEAVDIETDGSTQYILANSTTGTGWPDEEDKRAFMCTQSGTALSCEDLGPPIYYDSTADKNAVGTYSEAVQVNRQGEVIITADDGDGRHAYYWDGVSYRTTSLPLSDDSASVAVTQPDYELLGRIIGADSEAVAINENGQVIVNSGDTAVFVELNDDAIEVLNFFPEESATTATDLNDSGHVVGTSGDEGFFWRGGAMYPMGHLGGGDSDAVDVNNNDVVAGNSTLSSGATHAIVWSLVDGRGEMLDLGTLGGTNSYAVAINDAGQVVGYSDTGETYEEGGQSYTVVHGFLWQDGVMYDLGTHHDFYSYPFDASYPMSEAAAISENGDIVGNSLTINNHSRGFHVNVAAP